MERAILILKVDCSVYEVLACLASQKVGCPVLNPCLLASLAAADSRMTFPVLCTLIYPLLPLSQTLVFAACLVVAFGIRKSPRL